MSENKQGYFVMTSGEGEQPYDYAVGTYGSKFLVEVRDNNKFTGIKCSNCNKVYVPPRRVCGPCFKEMTELVDVSSEGVIDSYTILRFQFLDPETGEKKPVPYGYGFVRLDGADNNFQHFIEVPEDESDLKIGARVKAIFSEKKEGSLRDIKHFTLI